MGVCLLFCIQKFQEANVFYNLSHFIVGQALYTVHKLLLHSQTKAVADAAKDSAETSKAAAETSKDLLNKTTAAAQQAAASAASASYALGPDESGRLSFFIKKST